MLESFLRPFETQKLENNISKFIRQPLMAAVLQSGNGCAKEWDGVRSGKMKAFVIVDLFDY